MELLREAAAINAQMDHLTGIYNRETIMSMLFRETDRVQRLKSSLCMILFDVDDFESYVATQSETAVRHLASAYPYDSGETFADMECTFDLMDAMERANPRTQHYGIFLYTPFPSPLLDTLPAEFTPPQSLEEWGDIEVFHFLPPWHDPAYVRKLQGVSAVTRWAFFPRSRVEEHGPAFRTAYGALNAAARYRWRTRRFDRPLELQLANEAARRLRGFL